MKINDIRLYLKNNPQLYSAKNSDKIENLSSGKKYWFDGKCGHSFESLPSNVIKEDGLHCPVCAGRQVQAGVNDMWTTHPELAEHLLNKEDGYRYSVNSNVKLDWICDNCYHITNQSPSKMKLRKQLCNNCGEIVSYGQRFVSELLEQLCEDYIPEKIFEWSKNKRYDFYLPFYDCIIEVHGKQHRSKSDFSYLGGRTCEEERINDIEKYNLAIKNGIINYITIDCTLSESDYLKNSIMLSSLPEILNFKEEDIDWRRCNISSYKNITKEVCADYRNGADIHSLCDKYDKCKNTIMGYIIKGTKFGWCNYDPAVSRQQGKEKSKKVIVETMSKPVKQYDLDGNFINEFSGIQQAQRELGIWGVWKCLNGERKTAGGFQWRYSSDCSEVSNVTYRKSGKPYREINQYDKNMNFIKTWPSIAEAVKQLNINRSNIISVCKGKSKTSNGFIWRYKDDEKN